MILFVRQFFCSAEAISANPYLWARARGVPESAAMVTSALFSMRSFTISKLATFTAAQRGVFDSFRDATLTLALAARRAFAISMCPRAAAWKRGVLPSLSGIFTFAPAEMSKLTRSKCPCWVTSKSPVVPSYLGALTLAPAAMRTFAWKHLEQHFGFQCNVQDQVGLFQERLEVELFHCYHSCSRWLEQQEVLL